MSSPKRPHDHLSQDQESATPTDQETRLDRRRFLGHGALGLGAATLAACAGDAGGEGPAVHTNKKVTWRLASSFPRGLDTIFGAAEVMADRLEKMSDGRFRVRCYPGGEIVPNLEVMDAVQQGTVQVGHTASYYYVGKNPALAFDARGRTFLDSVQMGVGDALRGGERVFVYGEDVGGEYGNAFLLLRPLIDAYGDRLFNSTLSEGATLGVAVGAALGGLRPIAEIQFNDFIARGFNQLVNNA